MNAPRSFGVGLLLLVGCLGFAPTAAKADIFNLNATDTHGDTITGTLTIDTIGGDVTSATVDVSGLSGPFVLFSGPVSSSSFYVDTFYLPAPGGEAYMLLDVGSPLVGYTGGALAGDSELYPFVGGPAAVSGSLTPIPTPEPAFFGVLALGMSGLVFAVRRRRV